MGSADPVVGTANKRKTTSGSGLKAFRINTSSTALANSIPERDPVLESYAAFR
jgi:hypothetical protein